ncbi:MAG: methionine--tRNA ligase [Clostridiales bacterium]|jgi:methionyl-tRNA synthetase|nr:methionine--tRNA ligase [Clostridiales bacterium]
MKNILIGGAWPYANGSLHIGHIAALLPGDILARYHRTKGNSVFYVSGSDCYGTPITIRAKQEGKTPYEISEYYHNEFCAVFDKLGFSYDLYTKTSDERHIAFVRQFHKKMYEGEYIEERTVKQAFCPSCQKVLTDRLIIGKCPSCGEPTRGDQCEACGEVLEADTVVDAKCADCSSVLEFGETTQLFLLISRLEKELRDFLNGHPKWRKNAAAFTKRYIDEGLRDRAITRDLDWGIDVPKEGYADRKIYIWAENVLGYLSVSSVLCEERGVAFNELFSKNAWHYYVHGKDNIPFHTIILPSLLLAHGENLRLPDSIISSEYLTLEGRKISTSHNWAVWAKDVVDKYNPDALRYFFIVNGPEKRDTDFSWREFAERNNSELLGGWGNFVNRTLAFIVKYLSGIVPDGQPDKKIRAQIDPAFINIGEKIEAGKFKESLDGIFELVRYGNRYYDVGEPWKTRTENPTACADTLFNCGQLISNISILLAPFLPFSSQKIAEWLGLSSRWEPQYIPAGYRLPGISILFERIDKSVVEDELEKLKQH